MEVVTDVVGKAFGAEIGNVLINSQGREFLV